jgi:hypothetical protein
MAAASAMTKSIEAQPAAFGCPQAPIGYPP